jgi:large subunit ribosomal protein L15
MQLHQLKRKNPNYKSQVVGRGGKRGKTSGRGTKGQKARAGHKIRPEWRDLIKKIPKKRGESASGSLKSIAAIVASVNIGVLDTHFADGAKVTPKVLAEKGLIRRYGRSLPQVKLLGGGELTKKLTVTGVEVSATAKAAIMKAGGTVA